MIVPLNSHWGQTEEEWASVGTGSGGGGGSVWEEGREGWAPTAGDKHALSGRLLGTRSLPGAWKGSMSACQDPRSSRKDPLSERTLTEPSVIECSLQVLELKTRLRAALLILLRILDMQA